MKLSAISSTPKFLVSSSQLPAPQLLLLRTSNLGEERPLPHDDADAANAIRSSDARRTAARGFCRRCAAARLGRSGADRRDTRALRHLTVRAGRHRRHRHPSGAPSSASNRSRPKGCTTPSRTSTSRATRSSIGCAPSAATGVYVLGSFIFGLPSDRPATFEATADLAQRAELPFAQFVMLTPFPGTVDFERWQQRLECKVPRVDGVPVTQYWLIPPAVRPKVFMSHPIMSPEEIRVRTQRVCDRYYSLRMIWSRSTCVRSLRGRLTFVLVSKLYRQMYANTGIATDSARVARANRWARWLARPCRRLFAGTPRPDLRVPVAADRLVRVS